MVTLAQSSPGDRSARAPQSKTATVMLGLTCQPRCWDRWSQHLSAFRLSCRGSGTLQVRAFPVVQSSAACLHSFFSPSVQMSKKLGLVFWFFSGRVVSAYILWPANKIISDASRIEHPLPTRLL